MTENTRATEVADDNPIFLKAKAFAKSERGELVASITSIAVFAAIAVLSFFALTTQDGYFSIAGCFDFERAYQTLLVTMSVDRAKFAFLAAINIVTFLSAVSAIVATIVLSVMHKKLYRLNAMFVTLLFQLLLVFICFCMNVSALPNACLVSAVALAAVLYAGLFLFEYLRGKNSASALDVIFLVLLMATLFLISSGSSMFMIYIFSLAFGALKGKTRSAAHAALIVCAVVDIVMTALQGASTMFIVGSVLMIVVNAAYLAMYFVPALKPLLSLAAYGSDELPSAPSLDNPPDSDEEISAEEDTSITSE